MAEKKKESGSISRREFLKDAGLLVGGAAIGSTALLAACAPEEVVTTETVTTTVTETVEVPVEVPKAIGHIAQVSCDVSACLSCGTCELVCATVHEGAASPSLKRIWMDRRPFDGVYFAETCQQCDYPECYFACPLKDEVLCIDSVTGARYINNPDKCLGVGCKFCIEACPLDPPRINFDPERNVAVKCDLCKDREGGPACVEFCPALALKLV